MALHVSLAVHPNRVFLFRMNTAGTRIEELQARADRANKMTCALQAETDRGRACIGDALIDEVLKQLFLGRFISDRAAEELLSLNQPLGNHGARLKLAYVLGWIGPKTFRECNNVHKVRNAMAHDLDVDSFDHQKVKPLIDKFVSLPDLLPARLALRRDKFLVAVQFCIMQIWAALDKSTQSPIGMDRTLVRLNPEI